MKSRIAAAAEEVRMPEPKPFDPSSPSSQRKHYKSMGFTHHYKPHQGKREIARRLRQAQKRAGTAQKRAGTAQ